ncbi:MAG: type I polyketide synthase [Burkholderia sp.]
MKRDLNHDFDATPPSRDAGRQPQADAGGHARALGHVDTAIIGISARYPKAGDWRQFWENLRAGRDCIGEIPPERWDWRAHHDSARGTPGRSYTRWGGFLDGIDRFDPRFFRIAPGEAEHLDPQERLFLESAYLLIEDAGYTPAKLSASRRVAVFVGAMNSSYSLLASQWTLANRVSHVFDFHGPSLVVNSACSSSLSAIHLALESLATGTSEVAIAGGVNLIMHPAHYARLASVGMLSAGPHCRAFGTGADGFVDGEGVGAVLLKPLSRAIEDGDQIYGVIKGSALNAGGRTHGYTVPSPLAQGRLVAEAIERAGFAPRSIGCVEAHGTGTELGDPIEVRGLAEAFGATAGAAPWCALGSVKSNIGHGEGVAGIAGLTKLLLQMRHGQLAPSLHADTLNPRIDFSGTPFAVQRELAPWPRPAGHPRRAGVSSFGAGGANAHLLVEEYVAPLAAQRADALSPALIVLSAANPDRLRAVAQRLADFLDGEFGHSITLAELAYTLQVGREALVERLGFVADSLAQVRACLAAFLQDREAERPLLRTSVGRGRDGRSAMLDDEGFAQTLRGWVERGKHELLLKLWGQGEPLDWSLLYRGARPRRVSLPGYPFAGERYWAPAAVRYAGVARSRRARPAADAHLLLCRPAWREAPVPAAARRALPRRELWLLGSLAGLDDAALPALPIERFHSDEAEPVRRCADLYGQLHARLSERLRDKPSEPVLLQVAILGRDDELLLSGLSGMLRSLGQESRKLHGQLLMMEGREDRATWQARLDENAARPREDWVRYRQGRREAWALQELPPAAGEPAPPWRAQGVYLLSGGAGGLGLLFAEEIARRAEGATVILASRAAPDEARRARLAALGQQGLAIRHAVLDITDAAAVQALVDQIVAAHGRLDGVLHLAGVLRDGYLLDKQRDSVEQVLAPKLLGALHLDMATRALPLDCFVLFSSAAALFGNAGQADYAGANGFLDAFAAYRQAQGRPGRSLSVNWPLWAEEGMSMDTATEQSLTAGTGIRPMQAATGCRALAHALAGEFTQVLALEGEPARMRASLLETGAPSNLAAADAASPAADLPGQVRALVAALLKVEPEEIEAGQDIGDYGLDSIGFTHLANQLNQRFGSAVRPTDFMELETASVERIARLLLQLAAAEASGAPARAAAPESGAPSVVPGTRRGPGSGTSPATREAGAAHPDERLRARVREAVAALLKVEIAEVELDLDISDYGVDSIGFTHLANRLNEQHGTRLRATDFLELEQVSVIRIARLLREDPGSHALLDAAGAQASLVAAEGR